MSTRGRGRRRSLSVCGSWLQWKIQLLQLQLRVKLCSFAVRPSPPVPAPLLPRLEAVTLSLHPSRSWMLWSSDDFHVRTQRSFISGKLFFAALHNFWGDGWPDRHGTCQVHAYLRSDRIGEKKRDRKEREIDPALSCLGSWCEKKQHSASHPPCWRWPPLPPPPRRSPPSSLLHLVIKAGSLSVNVDRCKQCVYYQHMRQCSLNARTSDLCQAVGEEGGRCCCCSGPTHVMSPWGVVGTTRQTNRQTGCQLMSCLGTNLTSTRLENELFPPLLGCTVATHICHRSLSAALIRRLSRLVNQRQWTANMCCTPTPVWLSLCCRKVWTLFSLCVWWMAVLQQSCWNNNDDNNVVKEDEVMHLLLMIHLTQHGTGDNMDSHTETDNHHSHSYL